MRTAVLAATECLAISTTAFAEEDVGRALGTQPGISTRFEQRVAQPSGRSLRGLAGTRLGRVGNNFEGFARAGLERTWLNLDGVDLTGHGGGFAYRLDAILTSASIVVDDNVHRATLEAPGGVQADETLAIWGLGFSVGI